MVHYMNLYDDKFEWVKSGRKVVEVRLYDEKRRKLQIGDIIEFSKAPHMEEKVSAKVSGIQVFDSFEDLFYAIPKEQMGYQEITLDDFLKMAYGIYTVENEKKYGVVGIRVKLA